MDDKEYLKKVLTDIPIIGIREAVKHALVKRLMMKVVSLGSFFSFAPVAAVMKFVVGKLVEEILEHSVQFVRDEIHKIMVKKDFDSYRDANTKRKQLENSKREATKAELDALDEEIRNSIDKSIRIGRLWK